MARLPIAAWALPLLLAGCADDEAPADGSESSTGESTLSSADSTSSAGPASTATSSTVAGDETSTGSVESSSGEATTEGDTAGTFGTDVCGNGSRDPGEECDDGNEMNGDACSATCALTFEIAWTATVSGEADGLTEARAVVVDESDTIYVVGRRTTATGSEAWIGQYGPDGTPGWTLGTSGPDALGAGGVAIARAPGGLIGVVGETATQADTQAMLIAAIDPDVPSLAWTNSEMGGLANGVAFDPDGNLVVTGGGDDGHVWIGELDATGGLSWGQSAPVSGAAFDLGLAVSVDDEGSAEVLAMTSMGSAILAFADDGTPIGEVDSAIAEPWTGAAIVRGEGGDTIVAGGSQSGLTVWTLDESFDLVSEYTWGASMAAPEAVGFADSRIHVAGARSSNAWVGGFDESGDPWWSDEYENPDARGTEIWHGLAIDSVGDVIVVGRQSVDDQEYEMVIRKYRVF